MGCTATLTQMVGIEALREEKKQLQRMVEEYERRRDLCVGMARSIESVTCDVLNGAFYLWMNVSSIGLASKNIAGRLLQEGLVAVLSGSDFGEKGEGYIRISCESDV